MGKIKVIMDPEQRQEHLDRLLGLDGMSHIKENAKLAYCPISLTFTPDELKKEIRARQRILVKYVLKVSGITAYDPSLAKYSPDKNPASPPREVYAFDSKKIAEARFFVGHNMLPSTGYGIEAEKARIFNRISVVLMDKSMRVSRMQPPRTIYLQYSDFRDEAKQFVPVFELLQDYDPGMGFNDNVPVLLGFNKRGGKVVDLEETIYREFPALQYQYDGRIPIVKLRSENPGLFYS